MGIPVDLNEMRAISIATLAFYLYLEQLASLRTQKRDCSVFSSSRRGITFSSPAVDSNQLVFCVAIAAL